MNQKKFLKWSIKIFEWSIKIFICALLLLLITFFIFFYFFFRESPSMSNVYKRNRNAIEKLEKTYGSILALSKEDVVENLGEPDVVLTKKDYSFDIYDDFSDLGADEYFYYVIGENLFSHKIYLIGFLNDIVVGAHKTVEDW